MQNVNKQGTLFIRFIFGTVSNYVFTMHQIVSYINSVLACMLRIADSFLT